MTAAHKLTAQQRATRHWQRAPAQLHLVRVVPVPPSLLDRIAAAGWRLHDNARFAWSIVGGIVLSLFLALDVAVLAYLLGWTP